MAKKTLIHNKNNEVHDFMANPLIALSLVKMIFELFNPHSNMNYVSKDHPKGDYYGRF